MKTTRTIGAAINLLILLLVMAAFAPAANAFTYTKGNNTTALNLTGSWVEGVVPTATDIALWDITVTGANSSALGANTSWKGIQITNPGGTVGITGTQSLTLGASGIDASTYTGTLQLQNTTVILGAAQTWNFGGSGALNIQGATLNNGGYTLTINSTNNAKTLSISGDMTGSGGLTMTGGGMFGISGASTYNGTTTIDGGSTFSIGRTGATGSISSASLITGTTAGILRFDRTTDFTFANTISGGIVLNKFGAATTILTGANTNTGATGIFNGILSVSSLNSVSGGAASSNLGAPTTVTAGTILFGTTTTTGQLTYTGTGETTDRVIRLNGTTGGATIDQSGTGLLKFTSATTATGLGNKTLTLQGSTSGTGEIAGAIVNSTGFATSVTKAGNGTWTLSGANTYTGATTVSVGTLLINGSSSGTGATTVANGATFGHTGSTALSLGGDVTFSTGALITLSLGAPGVNSSLARTGGVWAFDSAQAFTFDNIGATTGTYSGLITGLDGTEAGISTINTWTISNAGWTGTFSYGGGSVDLNLTAIPEPATWILLAVTGTFFMVMRRRNKGLLS